VTPEHLISIDPGVKACAVATWLRGTLVLATSWPAGTLPSGMGSVPDRVVWELPQADGRATPADDLIALTAAGADLARAFAGLGGEVKAYRPRDWKGSTPKPVHHARLWEALTDAERLLLGGSVTASAIWAACERGATDRWRKAGATYYRARELPSVDGRKITHDLLDAVALGLYDLGRLRTRPTKKGSDRAL
jgi:hypothetical protein